MTESAFMGCIYNFRYIDVLIVWQVGGGIRQQTHTHIIDVYKLSFRALNPPAGILDTHTSKIDNLGFHSLYVYNFDLIFINCIMVNEFILH